MVGAIRLAGVQRGGRCTHHYSEPVRAVVMFDLLTQIQLLDLKDIPTLQLLSPVQAHSKVNMLS